MASLRFERANETEGHLYDGSHYLGLITIHRDDEARCMYYEFTSSLVDIAIAESDNAVKEAADARA